MYFGGRILDPPYGVRRQSEAATALLLIHFRPADSKAASRFACRRTPYIPQ